MGQNGGGGQGGGLDGKEREEGTGERKHLANEMAACGMRCLGQHRIAMNEALLVRTFHSKAKVEIFWRKKQVKKHKPEHATKKIRKEKREKVLL